MTITVFITVTITITLSLSATVTVTLILTLTNHCRTHSTPSCPPVTKHLTVTLAIQARGEFDFDGLRKGAADAVVTPTQHLLVALLTLARTELRKPPN